MRRVQVIRTSMLDLLIAGPKSARGPHVARQRQLVIDTCCPRLTSTANPPAAAAAADRRYRLTDRLTGGYSTMYAIRVIK